jgi:uncharacterized protein
MASQIILKMDGKELKAQLNDNPVAEKFLKTLPAQIKMSRWGDEYYGDCGVDGSLDDSARDILEIGELAFWPPGSALCIFFGPTPASTDGRPKAASDVVPIGKITAGVDLLKMMGGGIVAEISES